MTQSRLTVSESEAAERLEELVDLANLGLEVIIVADSGEHFALRPVNKTTSEPKPVT